MTEHEQSKWPRLYHHSAEPLGEIYAVPDQTTSWGAKPKGLWVSTVEDGWYEWCSAEGFRLGSLACEAEIILVPEANILWLKTADEVRDFSKLYRCHDDPNGGNCAWIDWPKVAEQYQGILIVPYQYKCRLTPDTFWYYGWDCSSGCIWDPACIGEIIRRSTTEKAACHENESSKVFQASP